MKKTAKVIALVLSLVMVLGMASAYVISANAVAAPSLNVTQTGKSGNKVTVAVNLTDGTFNAMDFQFDTSAGVTCDSISASGGYGNTANGKVSMASVSGYPQGSVITATFTVPEEGDYSISGSVSSCSVTEGTSNVEVGANVSGKASGTNTKPTEKPTEKPKSTTKSTTKPTTKSTTKSTKPGNSTTKKTSPTKSTTKTTLSTTDLPTNETESTTLDDFDVSITDFDEFVDADIEYAEDAVKSKKDKKNSDDDEDEDEGIDQKLLIGGIAGGALLIIAATVTAIVVSNKRKNNDDEDDYE